MVRAKLLIILFLFTFFFWLNPNTVSAHVLKIDGNIGAVMHIDPDDDPIAGSQAGFFFEFKDKQGKFQPQNCDCTFSITENSKEIYQQPLFQNNPNPSLESASVFFTFPERNVYQVKVVGKPTPADAFQPFTLVYDVRVDKQTPTPQNTNWFVSYLPYFGMLIIVGLLIMFVSVRHTLQKGGNHDNEK